MRTLLIPLALAVLLSACGFKGPLYLPTQDTTNHQKQEASQP